MNSLILPPLLLLLTISHAEIDRYLVSSTFKTASADNSDGVWSVWEYCNNVAYAKGYQLKTDGNTMLLGLKLVCSDGGEHMEDITSWVGGSGTPQGKWGKVQQCNEYLTGATLTKEGILEMRCDGKLQGEEGQDCESGARICGLLTRLKGEEGRVVELEFACCK